MVEALLESGIAPELVAGKDGETVLRIISRDCGGADGGNGFLKGGGPAGRIEHLDGVELY
jgi:hypothetical protein